MSAHLHCSPLVCYGVSNSLLVISLCAQVGNLVGDSNHSANAQRWWFGL